MGAPGGSPPRRRRRLLVAAPSWPELWHDQNGKQASVSPKGATVHGWYRAGRGLPSVPSLAPFCYSCTTMALGRRKSSAAAGLGCLSKGTGQAARSCMFLFLGSLRPSFPNCLRHGCLPVEETGNETKTLLTATRKIGHVSVHFTASTVQVFCRHKNASSTSHAHSLPCHYCHDKHCAGLTESIGKKKKKA